MRSPSSPTARTVTLSLLHWGSGAACRPAAAGSGSAREREVLTPRRGEQRLRAGPERRGVPGRGQEEEDPARSAAEPEGEELRGLEPLPQPVGPVGDLPGVRAVAGEVVIDEDGALSPASSSSSSRYAYFPARADVIGADRASRPLSGSRKSRSHDRVALSAPANQRRRRITRATPRSPPAGAGTKSS